MNAGAIARQTGYRDREAARDRARLCQRRGSVEQAQLAAIGLWQLLIMVRPGYATLLMGGPYRPQLYRWALVGLTVTILLSWYLTLRRWIGATSLAIGALLWPAILGW